MMLSKMNRATVFVVQSLTDATSSHLVRYSMEVIMYLSPVQHADELMGPTKSISHFLKGSSVITGNNGSSSLQQGLLMH
jgi:hypothetical protein